MIYVPVNANFEIIISYSEMRKSTVREVEKKIEDANLIVSALCINRPGIFANKTTEIAHKLCLILFCFVNAMPLVHI